MTIEFFEVLQIPTYAIIFALVCITAVAILLLRSATKFKDTKRTVFLKKVSFIAEVLTAFATIGIVGLLGVTKSIEMQALTTRSILGLEWEVTKPIYEFRKSHCLVKDRYVAPVQKDAAFQEACNSIEGLTSVNLPDLSLVRVSNSIAAIINLPKQDGKLSFEISKLPNLITDLLEERKKLRLRGGELESLRMNASGTSILVLICAIFALVGVGLKCGKARIEWIDEKSKKSKNVNIVT
jgi:hypothetical protein